MHFSEKGLGGFKLDSAVRIYKKKYEGACCLVREIEIFRRFKLRLN